MIPSYDTPMTPNLVDPMLDDMGTAEGNPELRAATKKYCLDALEYDPEGEVNITLGTMQGEAFAFIEGYRVALGQ